MYLSELKLKVNIAHFRLLSASQRRDCISSLLHNTKVITRNETLAFQFSIWRCWHCDQLFLLPQHQNVKISAKMSINFFPHAQHLHTLKGESHVSRTLYIPYSY